MKWLFIVCAAAVISITAAPAAKPKKQISIGKINLAKILKIPEIDNIMNQLKKADAGVDTFRKSFSKVLDKAKDSAIKQFDQRIVNSKKVFTDQADKTALGLKANEAKGNMEKLIKTKTDFIDIGVKDLKGIYEALKKNIELAKLIRKGMTGRLEKMGPAITENLPAAFKNWIDQYG